MTDRTARECPCGGIAVPSLRYGPTPTPVDVLACFECGQEQPALYRRTAEERDTREYGRKLEWRRQRERERVKRRHCCWCSKRTRIVDPGVLTCSADCAALLASAERIAS